MILSEDRPYHTLEKLGICLIAANYNDLDRQDSLRLAVSKLFGYKS